MFSTLRPEKGAWWQTAFETWLRTQGLFQQADRWRHRTAWEQARHTPPAPQRTAQRAEAAEKRQAEQRTFQMPDFQSSDLAAAYYAHLENIRRHLTIEDYSRVDAMIALRLRSNGHSRENVEETIRACAPTIRDSQTGRNWQRYAERTAYYAFGPAGDRDLERNEWYRELWRNIERTEGKEQRIRMK